MRIGSAHLEKTSAALLLAVALAGCSSTTTKIYVKSSKITNDGNVLYMMVRESEGKGIEGENYQQMASRLFVDPPDATTLTSQPIFPSSTASLVIDAADKDIVIYFFFTNPGNKWYLPLRKPLPAEVYIELGQQQIEGNVRVRKR